MTPPLQNLFQAIEDENASEVIRLLETDVHINEADEELCAPLHLAAMNEFATITKILLERGADISAKDIYGMTPLAFAAWLGREENVRLLLEHGAGQEQVELQRAVRHATIDNGHNVIPILVEYGAQIGLVEAIYLGKDELVTKYLAEGADVNQYDDGIPLLIHATRSSHYCPRLETYLPMVLELGADPDAQSLKDGYTALMLAVDRGFIKCVEILLQHGANKNITNFKGETALDIAIRSSPSTYDPIMILLSV